MMDVKDSPYAEWLEGTIRTLAENDVKSISLAARLGTDEVFTAYFECDMTDMVILAENIRMDATAEMIRNNRDLLMEDDDG